MILNGEHQSSKTVLNGKRCTAYDRAKVLNDRAHRLRHQQWIRKYRTGNVSQKAQQNSGDIFKPSTIIVCIVFWLIFLTFMGCLITFVRMLSM